MVKRFSLLATLLAVAPCITIAPTVSASVPTPPPGFCIDDVPNCGTVAAPGGRGIKWHPGHYMLTYLGDKSQWLAQIDATCNQPGLEGVVIREYWANLEGAKGDYSKGIAAVRTYLARAQACDKRLIFTILDRKFSGASAPTSVVPAYIVNDPAYGGGVYTASDRVIARVWDSDVVDRMIALSDALAAEFDDEPFFEAIGFEGETALGGTVFSAPDWSAAAYHAQLKRLMTAMRTAWTTTGLRVYANYHSAGQQLLPDLLKHAQSLDFIWSGPDFLPESRYPGTSNPPGPTDGVKAYTGQIGGTSFRGQIAFGPDNQSPVYGAKAGSYLPGEILDYANSLGSNYLMWIRGATSQNTASFNRSDMSAGAYVNAVSWESMLKVINSRPLANTRCPANMICNTR